MSDKRIRALERVVAELADSAGIDYAPEPYSDEELMRLQADLDELERTDPDVAAARRNLDAVTADILADKPSGIRWGSCFECGGLPYHDFDPKRGCCPYAADAPVHAGK